MESGCCAGRARNLGAWRRVPGRRKAIAMNVDMIAGFGSIGGGFVGGFAVEFLLLWLG